MMGVARGRSLVIKSLFLLFLVVPLYARDSKVNFVEYDKYFEEAGEYYNIPPLLLKKIATIESGINPNVINRNANGTKDYGLMQINSLHLVRLSQWGINQKNILDPKINIYAGSWLLSEHIKKYGFNLQAVGRYHSATEGYKEKWLHRLIKAFK